MLANSIHELADVAVDPCHVADIELNAQTMQVLNGTTDVVADGRLHCSDQLGMGGARKRSGAGLTAVPSSGTRLRPDGQVPMPDGHVPMLYYLLTAVSAAGVASTGQVLDGAGFPVD